MAFALTLPNAPVKKASAFSCEIVILPSVSIFLNNASHFFQVFVDSFENKGLFGKRFIFDAALEVALSSFQSTQALPSLSCSSSSMMSSSLYPAFLTWTQKSTNSSAVIAPLPSTSTSLNMASTLSCANAPLKKAEAWSRVTALLRSASIALKSASTFSQAAADNLHPNGLLGNGLPTAGFADPFLAIWPEDVLPRFLESVEAVGSGCGGAS
mmetsp:Transcript_55145/g.129105  ORF Transcript_55145/g.129105 Transcript_55145/m.129105 type:complete len:212 (+) Transcript_55145:308-943(+)